MKILSIIFSFIMKIFGKEYINFYNIAIIRDWQKRQLDIMPTFLFKRNFSRNYNYVYETIREVIKNNPKPVWVKEIKDYWKTHTKFILDRHRGDCEDIAIFYYISLLSKLNQEDLALRVIKNPYGKGYHTVTVIYTDDRTLIIDNGKLRTEIEKNEYKNVKVECTLFSIKGK